MGKSGDDAVGVLMLIFITLSLGIAVVLLGLAFVILVALLFLWWVLTYWLLRLLNDWLTDNYHLILIAGVEFYLTGKMWGWFGTQPGLKSRECLGTCSGFADPAAD